MRRRERLNRRDFSAQPVAEDASMPGVYHQSAVNIGGSCDDFEQTVYINATGWGSPNVSQRRGARTAGEGLKSGVCMALSATYLSKRGDFAAFKERLATPDGMAWIRGMMNLSHEGDRTGAFKSNAHRFSVYPDMLKTLGITYTGQQRTAENSLVAEGVNGFTATDDGLYYINAWGGGEGHCLAAIKSGSAYKFFDPNFGNASLPDRLAFNTFVTWVFASFYSTLNAVWLVQRFSL
jgi:hypothetical protein